MFLQLRRATQEAITITNLAVNLLANQPRDELGHNFDQNPTIGPLRVLKRALLNPPGRGPIARVKPQGRQRRGGENVVREAVEGEEEVGLASDKLVVDGEGWDRAAEEEWVRVAHHAVGELEHDPPGKVFSGEDPDSTAVKYELDGGVVRAEAIGGDYCVSHFVNEIKDFFF